MKEVNIKTCPYTHEDFVAKRSNQVYIDKAAQIENNNLRARKKTNELKPLFKIIEKNYIILKEVLGDKNSVVISTEYLKGKGFNSKYFTHLDLDNNKYMAGINDIIIEKIGGSKVEIIKKLKTNDSRLF